MSRVISFFTNFFCRFYALFSVFLCIKCLRSVFVIKTELTAHTTKGIRLIDPALFYVFPPEKQQGYIPAAAPHCGGELRRTRYGTHIDCRIILDSVKGATANMKGLRLIIPAALCAMALTACSAEENYENTAATHTPEAATHSTAPEENKADDMMNGAGEVIDDTGNIVEDAGNAAGGIIEDAGKAVDDAANSVGNAVKSD